jgi:hypothetical protein
MSFLANVQLEGTSEVLQVLVSSDRRSVWNNVDISLNTLNKELAGALFSPEHNDLTLTNFLHIVGRLVGKDPEQWERQGRPKIEYSEREFVRCDCFFRIDVLTAPLVNCTLLFMLPAMRGKCASLTSLTSGTGQ